MTEHKSPIQKESRKKLNIAEHKKVIIGGGLVIAVAITGLIIGISIFQQDQDEEIVLTIPMTVGLNFLDTVQYYMPQSESAFVINQIAEGLIDYKVTDEGTEFIPNLALNWTWSPDGMELTCNLRRDVQFHDRTPFNASAVKWNFDRINRTIEYAYYPYMWFHSDLTHIINETVVLDDYIIKFILNRPYVPFEALLANSMAYILSPSSTPANEFVDLEAGLVGTGPFMYKSSSRIYDPLIPDHFKFINFNTTLVANSEYWGGEPKFDKLFLPVISNGTIRKEKMLSGEIDLNSLWTEEPETYTSVSGFRIEPIISQDIWYITMNNSYINTTMRKAISWALDYDQLLTIVEPDYEWGVTRCRSPLSKGQLYSNWTAFEVPTLNITKARQALLDANWPGTSGLTADNNVSAGNEWEVIANSATPLASYNISYPISSLKREAIANVFHKNLTQIGISVEPLGVTWPEYWFDNPISQFYLTGWAPDINDPRDSINPLFSCKEDGHSNWNYVNDTQLQQWMEEAQVETNRTARERLYYQIQERLIEEVYPVIWYFTPQYAMVHPDYLSDIDYLTFPYKFLVKDLYFIPV
ncbi:MAG: ABC transporter substrate-binding protein [Candidatus Hermodarchaeota archaeon]